MNTKEVELQRNPLKESFCIAAALRMSDEPRRIWRAMEMFREIIRSETDDSPESFYWKNSAAIELGLIYLNGIDNVTWVQNGGDDQSEYDMDPDLLKAYGMILTAVKNGCTDGVEIMGELYLSIGEFGHAADIFADVIRHGYKGAEESRKILAGMVERGQIDSLPDDLVKHRTLTVLVRKHRTVN